MGNNDKRIRNRERVYRAIVNYGKEDLFVLRTRLVKNHIIDSGNKFDTAIEDLKKDGRIVVTGKTVAPNPSNLKTGTFFQSGNKCYVVLDDGNKQFAINRNETQNAHSGDRVSVGFSMYNSSQPMPFIVAAKQKTYARNEETEPTPKNASFMTNENPNLVYGRVMKSEQNNLVFIPNDKKRFKDNIMILNDKKTWAKYQDKICTLELIPSTDGAPNMGYIKEIKGDAGNPIHEYDVIAESHGANMSWSDELILREIEKIPTSVDLSKYNIVDENGKILVDNNSTINIVDLRKLKLTTTDPAKCKDMDDAICSTYDKNGNLIVYTAVADVSMYVDLNSEIGRRYIKGGFTTYAPNKAYNILPPELSTGICSLNPNVDRLAFVIKSVIDVKTGEPIESTFMEAVIESKEKFSYEQAQEITDSHPEITRESIIEKIGEGKELTREEQVVANKLAADILWKGFKSRNQIEFNTNNEYDVVFSKDYSNIIDIVPQDSCAYHKVIEAFMVTANEATAKFAMERNIPIIYRVHDEPSEDRIDQAYEFFSYLKIPFEGDLSAPYIKQLLQQVKGTSKEKVVNNFLVRLQSKAKYSITPDPRDVEFVGQKLQRKATNNGHNASKSLKNLSRAKQNLALKKLIDKIKDAENEMISHYGLQSKHYSHTTSPIRRITDYVTHYNIKAFLNGTEMIPANTVREISIWANQMEDENTLAEREFDELNSAIYCENHINEVMKGRICAFKYLVEGKNVGIENIMVIVENEEKGIRVQIPAIEVLGSKIANAKNIGLSQFGSAIINKVGGNALVTLCDEIEFKIAESNRVTRECFASTNMIKDFTKTSFVKDMQEMQENAKVIFAEQYSANRHEKNQYDKNKYRKLEEENSQYGSRKAIKELKNQNVAGDIEQEEAQEYSKKSRIKAKSNRDAMKAKHQLKNYSYEDYLEEEDDAEYNSKPISNQKYDPYEDEVNSDEYQAVNLFKQNDDTPENN